MAEVPTSCIACPAMQVSRAHALEDEARSLVAAGVPAALAQRCEEIAAAGGPGDPPPGATPDEPVAAQLLPVVRASRLPGGGPPGGAAAANGLLSDEDGREDGDRCLR